MGRNASAFALADIAIIRREWLSEDRLKLDGFKDDPMVADMTRKARIEGA